VERVHRKKTKGRLHWVARKWGYGSGECKKIGFRESQKNSKKGESSGAKMKKKSKDRPNRDLWAMTEGAQLGG